MMIKTGFEIDFTGSKCAMGKAVHFSGQIKAFQPSQLGKLTWQENKRRMKVNASLNKNNHNSTRHHFF